VSVALLIIWKLFDSYPQLSSSSHIGRFLTLVGRRSLDVYFIHYFFLPKDLTSWGIYFQSIDEMNMRLRNPGLRMVLDFITRINGVGSKYYKLFLKK